MNRSLMMCAILAVAAVCASGQPVIGPDGTWRVGWPTTLTGPGWATVDATVAQAQAAGYRLPTQAELDAKSAQDAIDAQAAQAEAEAQAAQATLPATFENGVAVLGHDGHWMELVPVGDDVVPIQISNSPLDPATRAAMKAAALALANSGKSAFRAANAELKATMTNDVAQAQAISVNATSSTAQVRSAVIDLRRELIDAQRNIQEMRRLLLKYAKEDDQ